MVKDPATTAPLASRAVTPAPAPGRHALAALLVASLLPATLAACGPEVAGVAAGTAAASAKEAQEKKAQALQQVKDIEKAQQQGLDNLGKAEAQETQETH